MSHRPSPLRRPLSLLGAVLLTVLALASSAQAAEAPWGELEHFGEKGTGLGQLEQPEYAFGIDQTDGGMYVVDTVAEGKNFRIQKFLNTKGKYEAVASATFKPKDPGGEEEDEVEGVAFDPSMKRAYLLVSEARPPLKKGERIDQFDGAAAEVYAFSTEPSGNKLVPASGAGAEGLLAGAEVLEPLSNTFGVSVLEPGGIAVNPVNHNLLITGFEDRGKLGKTQEGTTVVQQLEPSGKLGSRYVDETDFFEECECVNSPVVTPSGNIYVLGELDELDELPSNLNSATAPTHVFSFDCETCTFNEHLTDFPGQNPYNGSQMSLGPEGNIYIRARIRLASEEEFFHGGVLVLSPTFGELGWTGGNTAASETQTCAVNEALTAPVIAAGKTEHTVFMLARNKNTPKVMELGPGGSGCPKGSATVPTAKSGGVELEPVPIADKVTLSSTLTQANALSVEWDFGDGSTQTVSTRQQQKTEVQHTFKKGGKLTITEKIHTDDLASPLIEVKRQLTVVAGPTIGGEEAQVQPDGLTVALKGTVNPNGKKTECKFEYGKASEGFPQSVACSESAGSGEVAKEVSAKITSGLAKHTEYHFRLQAKSEEGEATGGGALFTTGPAPVVHTEPASAIGQTTATLNGKVNPEGASTECKFEYGPTNSYGASVPCTVPPGSGEAPVAEAVNVSGLKAGSGYHFRIVAKAGTSTSFGGDQVFSTTPGEKPKEEPKEDPKPVETKPEEVKPKAEVLPETTIKPIPVVTIATSASSVSAAGAFPLKLTCPGGESSCTGTVAVQTLSAVSASAHAAKKKAILMLASGRFALSGGQAKTLTLHLSAKARSLLAHSHVLRARVTIAAHDPLGGAHTTVAIITLRPAKKHH